jgi:hypothetical protein
MVQVDVFWSYAFGSGFALAAWRQLRRLEAKSCKGDRKSGFKNMMSLRRIVREMEKGDSPAFDNEYFRKSLLFSSLLFVPSGANLLWSNPNWETMQVGSYQTIPGWLISAFSITNITQGIMGFEITRNYLIEGRYDRAIQQFILSYLGFWFILVNGWDKRGYRRFFSRNREAFDDWKWGNFFGWARSDVAMILIAYGVVLIPILLYWTSKWTEEGVDEELERLEKPAIEESMNSRMIKDSARHFGVISWTLGSAVVANLLVRKLGWVIGLAAFSGLFGAGTMFKWSPGMSYMKELLHMESLEGEPA